MAAKRQPHQQCGLHGHQAEGLGQEQPRHHQISDQPEDLGQDKFSHASGPRAGGWAAKRREPDEKHLEEVPKTRGAPIDHAAWPTQQSPVRGITPWRRRKQEAGRMLFCSAA